MDKLRNTGGNLPFLFGGAQFARMILSMLIAIHVGNLNDLLRVVEANATLKKGFLDKQEEHWGHGPTVVAECGRCGQRGRCRHVEVRNIVSHPRVGENAVFPPGIQQEGPGARGRPWNSASCEKDTRMYTVNISKLSATYLHVQQTLSCFAGVHVFVVDRWRSPKPE